MVHEPRPLPFDSSHGLEHGLSARMLLSSMRRHLVLVAVLTRTEVPRANPNAAQRLSTILAGSRAHLRPVIPAAAPTFSQYRGILTFILAKLYRNSQNN